MVLIWALKNHLPGGVTEKEADTWLLAYTFISDMMIEEMPPTPDIGHRHSRTITKPVNGSAAGVFTE